MACQQCGAGKMSIIWKYHGLRLYSVIVTKFFSPLSSTVWRFLWRIRHGQVERIPEECRRSQGASCFNPGFAFGLVYCVYLFITQPRVSHWRYQYGAVKLRSCLSVSLGAYQLFLSRSLLLLFMCASLPLSPTTLSLSHTHTYTSARYKHSLYIYLWEEYMYCRVWVCIGMNTLHTCVVYIKREVSVHTEISLNALATCIHLGGGMRLRVDRSEAVYYNLA